MIVEDDGMERRGRLLAGRLLGDLQVWGGSGRSDPNRSEDEGEHQRHTCIVSNLVILSRSHTGRPGEE